MTIGVVAFLAGIGLHIAVTADGLVRPNRPDGAPAAENQAGVPPPGPTRLVEGVPAGFASTADGATAAAANLLTTGQTLIDMDPLAAEEAVRQMSAEASADRQVAQLLGDLRRVREMLRSGTGPITIHQTVLAARVEQFEEGRSRVAVWNVAVLSRDGIAAPQAAWKTTTVDLVWERGDWRIRNKTYMPGPAPMLDDSTTPASSAQLATALDGFTPLTASPFVSGDKA